MKNIKKFLLRSRFSFVDQLGITIVFVLLRALEDEFGTAPVLISSLILLLVLIVGLYFIARKEYPEE